MATVAAAGPSDGAARMANIAARLMGNRANTPASSSPASTSPVVSNTTTTAPASSTFSSPTVSNASIAPPPFWLTPNSSTSQAAFRQTPSQLVPTPKPEEDTVMEDYTAAPSLQGSAEQLALARQFSLSATPGRRKVRPGKRERLLSRAAVQSHTLTGSSSPRRAVAVTAASGGFPAASNTPRLRYNAAPRAGADPTETNSDTKRRRSSATSATFGWNTFASPSSSKTLQQAEDKPSVPSEKAAHTHAQPLDATSTSKLTEGRSPPVPEVKDITNMLQARTSGNIATIAMPRVPSKESVARAGNLTNREIEQTASQRLVPNPEIDDGRETDPAASPSMPEHKSSELPIRSVKAEAPFAWSDLDADAPVPVKPRLADTQSSLKGNTPLVRKADTANDESLAAIAYLKFEVVRLSNRTKIMEQENFTMQKQLETVLQAEELPQIFRYFECESTVWTRCQMS